MLNDAASRVTAVYRVHLIIALFVALIFGLVLYFQSQMDAAVGIRIFVSGEGLWAKAQKNAILKLNQYGNSRDEADYQAYLNMIKVPLGYQAAREEIMKSRPDLDIIRAGCLQGGLHPVDIEYAIPFFRRFRHMPYLSLAMEHWHRGDLLIAELMEVAGQLHEEIAGGHARPAAIRAIAASLDDIDRRLTVEEDQFSATLAEASRWANEFSRKLTYAVALLIVALGMALSWSIIKRIRATENALIESEVRYRSIFERASDIIYSIAPDGKFTSVSPSCQWITGWSPAEYVGQSFAGFTHPDDLSRAEEIFRTALARQRTANVEVRMKQKSGEYIEGEHSVVPVIRNGCLVGVLGIARDITARKRVEAELIAARQAAENANLAKTRFLAAASHDLRQPLQAIGLFHETLVRTGLNEKQEKISQHLSASLHSLGELLNKLLDLSRLDADMIKPQPAAIRAMDLIETLDAEFSDQARKKNLRLNLFCPLRGLTLFSDANLLQDLMRNLIGNAVKYTEKGGILLSVRRRRDRALIQVWDTGIGIDREHLDLIFEEYFQVGNPERHRAKGVGLGLAIVRRLSELLGADVSCRSRVGRGSVFEISLPLIHESDEHAAPAQPPAILGANAFDDFAGKRIVVIEDDMEAGKAIKLSLETLDIRVSLFGTAEEALGNAETKRADYYITDYHLPGMNGLKMLEDIQNSSAKQINAVLLTGEISSPHIEQLMHSRWTVLFKPASLPALLTNLRMSYSR
ncbi:MAG: PAS domain S-box protein [Sideroxyarcus sp.]